MKQNGSLCSVIAGNLALVSLATQTWFVTEDEGGEAAVSQQQHQRQPESRASPVSPPIIPGEAEAGRAEWKSRRVVAPLGTPPPPPPPPRSAALWVGNGPTTKSS